MVLPMFFPILLMIFPRISQWFSQQFLAFSLKGFPAINSHGAVWHRGTSLGDFLPMVFPRIFPHDISSQPTSRSLRPRPSASSSTAMAIIRRWSRLRRDPSDVFSGEGNQNYRNPPHISWENHGFLVKLFPPIQWFSRSWLGGWDHVEYRCGVRIGKKSQKMVATMAREFSMIGIMPPICLYKNTLTVEE